MLRKIVATFGFLFLICASIAQAEADDRNYHVTLPEGFEGDVNQLGGTLRQLFERQISPGDSLALAQGRIPKLVAEIAVPNEDVFEHATFKTRHFLAQLNAIGAAFDTMTRGALSATDLVTAYRDLGDARTTTEPLHVLVIAQPVQAAGFGAADMIDDEGKLRIPSSAHISATLRDTGFSVAGREAVLEGVVVHHCVQPGVKMSLQEDVMLKRFWAHWIGYQGGTLATWTADMSVCLNRFVSQISEPVRVEPIDPGERLAMIDYAPTGLDEVSATAVPAPAQEQPAIYNVFLQNPHPTVKNLTVYTGIEYRPNDWPEQYINAWCYIPAVGGNDVEVRISIGKKDFGKPVAWSKENRAALRSISMSAADFKASRSACAFPDFASQ